MRGIWRFISASMGVALLFCWSLAAENAPQPARNDAAEVVNPQESSSGTALALTPGVSKPTSQILADVSSSVASSVSSVSPARKRPYAGIDSRAELEPRHVLVRFAETADTAAQTQALSAVNGAKIARKFKLVPGLALVEIPATQGVDEALAAINQSQQVLYAEPNYVRHLHATPNDPQFGDLWGLENIGQGGGTVDDDIDATEAWDRFTGSPDLIVGVVDTGMDYTHPDLAGNRWVNTGEIPGNGIDDDGNGYVDDIYGYDSVNGDGDPMDDHGHGSHTAGTIGAIGNNGAGVVGVCWRVKLMAIKIFNAAGNTTDAAILEGWEYAADQGARVLNNSWGGGPYSQAEKDAIDALGARNIVYVSSAGNDSVNMDATPVYPASYDCSNIISVIATDRNDAMTWFSNYGATTTDLAAPGAGILSCAPGGGYQYMDGTSMAAPHVTGACALLLGYRPDLTVAEVKNALMSTADRLTSSGLCVSNGRLNVFHALASVGQWDLLHDNGPLFNGPGLGAGGADASVIQTALGLSTLGFTGGTYGGIPWRLLDRFTVPAGQTWRVREMQFFAYQTNSTTESTMSSVSVRVWNGTPGATGSAVVYGDTTTNRLVRTEWTHGYRVTEATPGNTQRPIMMNTVAVDADFTSGTYWVDWATQGSVSFPGPYVPPLTITGQTTTGQALQYDGAIWQAVADSGTGAPQGFPFLLKGLNGNLAVSPMEGMSSTGYQGRTFTPSQKVYTLSNDSTETSLTWSASAPVGLWWQVTPASGTLAPSGMASLTVLVDAASAPAGTTTASLVVTNETENTSISLPLMLIVNELPGTVGVSDSVLPVNDLTVPFGDTYVGLEQTESVTVRNSNPSQPLWVGGVSLGRYVENFDDGLAQNWQPSAGSLWKVVDGKYVADPTSLAGPFGVWSSLYRGESWSDCSVQVDVASLGSGITVPGLVVRATDDFDWMMGTGSAYLFVLYSDSGMGGFEVLKMVGGGGTPIAFSASPAVNPTGNNRLLVTVSGSTLEMYVNGSLVWRGTDTSISASGRIGTLAQVSGEMSYFDNVVVESPLRVYVSSISAEQQWYLDQAAQGWLPEEIEPLPYMGVQSANPVALSVSASESFRLSDLPTTFPLTLAAGASFTFQVTHQPQRVGADTGTLQIRTNDLDRPDVLVALSGTGLADLLSVSPEQGVWSEGHVGGSFAPATHTFTLATASNLTWMATADQPWVTISPSNGFLSNGSAPVTVGFNAQATSLTEGVYVAALTFHDNTTGLDTTRTVTLEVFTSAKMDVSPASLSASVLLGGSTSQSLTIGNAADADASLTVRLAARETGRVLTDAVEAIEEPAARDFAQIQGLAATERALVRFKPGTSEAARASVAASVGAEIVRTYRIVPDLVQIGFPPEEDLTSLLMALNAKAEVLYAEPDYQRAVDAAPNDPSFQTQWSLDNTGQGGGLVGADIEAVNTWDRQTGDRNVLVAVIDTGISLTHPDLVNNLWQNLAEAPGNGVDDDGNGYVDDVNGYDFISDIPDPRDDIMYPHGTAVASVIGAEGNNGQGIAGVCWQSSLMALKALDGDGVGFDSNLIEAVEYAVTQGAHVINASWGATAYSQSLKDVIDAANGAGVVVVTSAGNTASNLESASYYPASYGSKNIVSVLATNKLDQRASFSSYGAVSVDLGAPGEGVVSLYGTVSGSSYAAAHVSGACALLLSANPLARVQDLKTALLNGTDPVLPGLCVSGGRLNAAQALDLLPAPWLTLTPNALSGIAPGTSQTLQVGFEGELYSAGTYEAEIRIASNDRDKPEVIVPVTLTISEDAIGVTPTAPQTFSGAFGGPFLPTSATYVVSNTGAASYDYSATADVPWLDLSSASGTLNPGESVAIQAVPGHLANTLMPGHYEATVEFVNTTSGARIPCPVELDVTSIPPELLKQVLVYDFPLDTDPGWTTQGQWAFGVPTGGGSYNHDPVSGHTGANVYGYNLAGDYPNNLTPTQYLITQPLDFTDYLSVTMEFWRWLGIEPNTWDHATIDVSNDNGATWTNVWSNPSTAISENAWSLQSYDISAVTAGHANVRVRWGMGTTDNIITYPGWNIDDIQFFGLVASRELKVSPETSFEAEGRQHGPFDPTSATYVLTNTTTGSLTWSVAKSATWYDVAPVSGTLQPGETVSVSAALNAQTIYLHGGLHSDSLVFTASVGSPKNRSVSLNVLPYHGDDIYYFPFDTDPGWACEGQWAFGTPQGGAGDHGNPDPTSGHTGTNVYGYNLAGGYPNSLTPTQYLITEPLDFTGQASVFLDFWRWLGVEENMYDKVSIGVSNDNGATWTTIWTNPNSWINENAWTLQTYDISAVAAGHAQVRVRWGMGTTDSMWTFAGWNIDDVRFYTTKPWHELAANPTAPFEAEGFEAGPFAPTSMTYTLTNLTSQSLTWQVLNLGSIPSWLQFSDVAGSLAVGASTTVDVELSSAAEALPAGLHTFDVQFVDVANPGNPESRSVRLNVLPRYGEIAVTDSVAPADDHDLPFGNQEVGRVTTQTVTVQNSSPSYDLTVTSVTLQGEMFVYSEDFSDDLAQGWQPVTGTWSVAGGEYRVDTPGQDYYGVGCSSYGSEVWADVSAEVKVRRVATDPNTGFAALVLRASADYNFTDTGTGYVFFIDPRMGQFFVFYGPANTLSALVGWTASAAIQPEVNVLKASAVGTQLKFYINGSLVWQGTDNRAASGRVALVGGVGSGQATFFDDVWVSESALPFNLSKQPGIFPMTLAPGASATFDVGFAPTAVRTSTATLTVTSNDRTDPAVSVALSGMGLSSDFGVTPVDGLIASGHPGGPFTPASQTYSLFAPQAGVAVEYSASVDQPWVEVSPSTGTLAGQTTTSLTVSLTAAATTLTEGAYGATLTVRNELTGQIFTRPIVLSVFTTPIIEVSPASLSASLLPGAVQVKSLFVSNNIEADANLNVNLGIEPVTGDVSWLSTTPTAVTAIAPGDVEPIQVRFAPETVAPGVYEANLVLTSNDLTSPVVRVPVTLTVLDEALRVSPLDAWNISGPQGGEFTTESTELVVSNAGTAGITWMVNTGATWCEVAPAGGSLAAGASVAAMLRLTNEAYLLTPGEYTTQVVFTNPATGATYRRTVTLTVQAVAPEWLNLYWFPLDTDPGWTVQGQWAFGTPTGGGSQNHDPLAGHTGTNVYGYNLTGDYPNNMATPQYLISESLDFTGYSTVTLEFWRWLGVESSSFDHASIDVSNDDGATWTPVWAHSSGSLNPTAWTLQSYDISSVAGGHAQVKVRWGMGPTDSSITYPGWNIDDIAFRVPANPGIKMTPSNVAWNPAGREGGPFTPATAQYRLRNVSSSPLDWDSVTSVSWVVATPASGTLLPGEAVDVELSLDSPTVTTFTGAYPVPARYANEVIFFQTNGVSTSRTASVNLDVTARPGRIKVLDSVPADGDLRVPFGTHLVGTATTETVTIHNSDPTHELVVKNVKLASSIEFEEDFDSGTADGWVPSNPAQWQVVDGEYRAQGATAGWMQSMYMEEMWTDVSARVKVRRGGSNTVALAVRASDNFFAEPPAGTAYVVGFSGNGNYWVIKWTGSGGYAWMQPWTASPFLIPGAATNEMQIVVVGNQLRVYFNGNLAWSGTDSSISGPGRVALTAYGSTPTDTYYFDDVQIEKSPEGVLSVLDPAQVWYNAHPVVGGTPEVAPAEDVFESYPGGDPVVSVASDVSVLAKAANGSFLFSTPVSFPYSIAPGGDLVLQVGYHPLATGVKETKYLTIRSYEDTKPKVILPLTGQAVSEFLTVTPNDAFVTQRGTDGAFEPSEKVYVLTNQSTTTALTWAAPASADWFETLPASGTLSSATSASLTVRLTAKAQQLPIGVTEAVLSIQDQTNGLTTMRTVRADVLSGPQMSVAPTSVTASLMLGEVTTLPLTVSNASEAYGALSILASVRETSRSLASVGAVGVAQAGSALDAPDKGAMPPADFRAEAAPNQLLVRFAPSASAPRSGHQVNATAEQVRAQTLDSICSGAQIEKELPLVPGLCVVSVPPTQGIQESVAALNNSPDILYAEPNYLLKIHETIPNDPSFNLLWGMHNTGQSGGTPDADIDAPEAWDTATDASNVIVAVIDTGVDYNHADLSANMWVNADEIAGNGVDDDGNGYVDDIHGYDFANGDANPMDDHSHGTHCAGTIGAVGNNGLGVAGVAWNVQIMAMKFLDFTGNGDTANAIYCVQYAVQNGAQVLSNSWGGGSYSQALKDAIVAAGNQGVLFVASAGNEYGVNNDVTPSYPGSYDCSNIIAVMSTDRNEAVSDFSNFGPTSVDIAAPGSSIYSCLPGNLYGYKSGTSMAAPHVSGACALLLGHNPTLTVTQVQQALFSTVDPVVPGYCVTGGRLNLQRALSTGVSWLAVAPKTVTGIAPGSATALEVTLDSTGLEPGQYEGTVQIESNDPANPVVIVPVSLVVQYEGMRVTPTDPVALSGTRGGPFTSAIAEYRVLNPTGAAMNWTVTPQQGWLTALPTSGTLAAGESATVLVTVNSAGNVLPVGLHAGQLAFRDLAASSDVTRDLTLDIQPLPLTQVYYWPLDENPGWQVEGQWAFGQPTGAGSVAPDPTSGHTGSYVYGYNLSGDYANYLSARYLTTEVIDCSGLRNVTLSFWRWLCVEDSVYDQAAIEVSRDGVTWTTVWSHSEGTLTDSAWQEVSYDISAVADNQPQVQVRWAMGPTDDGNTFAGWNIDDIAILADPDDGLGVTPAAGLVAQGYQEGPFTPASAVYHLTNLTTETLNWESQISTGSWVTISPSSGALTAGQSVDVTVAVNAEAGNLPVGLHALSVTFKRAGNVVGYVRTVDLTVLARPGEVQVLDSIAPQTDLQMPFGAQVVGTRTTQTLTVQNTSSKYPLTLMSLGSYLYKNTFSGGGMPAGWTDSPPASWGMVAGEYRAQGLGYMQSMYMDQTWTDVSVRVKVRRGGSDTAMLSLRASDDFYIQPSAGVGYAVGFAGNGQFWVAKWIGGGGVVWLQPWTASPFLNMGAATNEMQFVAVGNQLRVYFNSHLAWSGTDDTITGPGKVALSIFGDTPTDAIYFDDLVVEIPSPSLLSVTDVGQSEGSGQPVTPGALQASPSSNPVGTDSDAASASVRASVSEMKADLDGGYAISGPDLPMTIPPNGSLTFDVGFEPTAVGDSPSFLIVQTDDLETSQTRVELSGRGVEDALDMTPADGFNSAGRPGGPFSQTSTTYVLSNVTASSATWSASTTQGWLQVTPASGTLDGHSSVTLTLSLTAAAEALPNGITTDTLTVLNTGTSYTLTRPATLTVEPTPTVEVDTTPIEVTLYVDGQETRTLAIGNAAVADLPLDFILKPVQTSYTLDAAMPRWFAVSPTSATGVAAGSSVNVSVQFSAVHVRPGTYWGKIRMRTNDLIHPTVEVPVSLRVNAEPLEVSPSDDQVTSGVRGTVFTPAQFEYVLSNNGPDALPWSAALSEGNWLSLDTASGTLASGVTATVRVSVTPEAALLPVSFYEQELEVTNQATGSVLKRTVQLVVRPLPQGVVADFPLDSDPGWIRGGQWAFGAPQGLGSHDGDPAVSHSGASVFGYNLAGDYENNLTPQALQTLAIDCSDSTNVQLTFWRWLGVESSDYDEAAVEVSADGTNWTPVWANPVAAVSDHQWTQVAYDISDVADGQPTVYVRWIMGATDDGVTYPGWNIDDVQILGDSMLPDIALDATSLNFGTITRTQATTSRTLTVVNHGLLDLTFTSVSFTGTDAASFSLDPASSLAPLGMDGLRALNVIFAPSLVGPKQAEMVIVTNDPDQTTVTISLSGYLVVDPPVLTPEPLFTAGLSNTIDWQASANAVAYEAQASTTPGFDAPVTQEVSSPTVSVVYANLTDGQTYWYRVRARDEMGNSSFWSEVTSSTQDNTPPVLSGLGASPAVATQGTTVTVTFSVSEPLTSAPLVTVNAHPASFVSATGLDYVYAYGVQDSANDPNGPASVRVQVLDRVSWPGELSSTTILTIDQVAPGYSDFQVTPAIAKQGTTVTLAFTVSETLGQTPVLSVNGTPATFGSLNGLEYTFTYVIGSDPEGEAVLSLDLRDVAGNQLLVSPVGQTLRVDNTAPTFLNLAVAPALAREGTDAQLTFTLSDAVSGALTTSPTVTVNGHAATYVSQSGLDYTYRYTVQSAASDPSGLATIQVAGTDLAGNTGQIENATLLRIDQDPPQILAVVATPALATEGQEVQVAVTVNEDMASTPTVTVNSHAVTWVGKAGFVYTFRYTIQGAQADPDGDAVIGVLATDLAGNQTALDVKTALKLDQTAPVYNNFFVNPARAAEGTTVTIQFLPSETLTSSPLVTVNGHPTVELPIDGLGYAYAYVVQNAATDPDGWARVEVTGFDLAGKQGTLVSTSTLYIDQINPTFTPVLAAPAVAREATTVSLTFVASEELGTTPTVTVNGSAADFVSQAETLYTYQYLIPAASEGPEGWAVIRVEGTDLVGKTGAIETTDSLRIDYTAPVFSNLTVTPDLAGAATSVTLTFQVSETLSTTPTVTVNGHAAVAQALSGGVYTFHYEIQTADPDGLAVILVTGTDVAGNPGVVSWNNVLAVDQTVPVFSNLVAAPSLARGGTEATLTFIASEVLATSPTVTVNGHAAQFTNLTNLTWTYRYTIDASDADGAAVILIEGLDLAGNAGLLSNNTALVVDQTAPVFSDLTVVPVQAREGASVTLTFTASEVLATSPTVTVNGHVAQFDGLTSLTWTYVYTVGADDTEGAAALLISGTDPAGNTGELSNNTALIVDKTAPVFSNLTVVPAQAVQGTSVTLTFTASEALVTSPTVTVNGHVAQFDGLTSLTWTYVYDVGANDTEGAATIFISGVDLAGNAGELSNNTALVVLLDTTPPVFSNLVATPALAKEGTQVSLTFSASEALLTSPTVTVNGHAAQFGGLAGAVWTFVYTVQADDAEGAAAILVSGLDLVGNPGQLSNNTALLVDKTAPVFSDLQASPALAKDGAQVSLFFLASETLGATPVLTVNGHPAQYVQASGLSYEFRYEVLAADPEGAAAVVVSGADVAGNTGQIESVTVLQVDRTAPTVALFSTAPDPVEASSMTVTVVFSEPVTGFEAGDVVVANAVLSHFTADAGGSSYSFALDLSASLEGLVTVSVGAAVAQDASGNANLAAESLSRSFVPGLPAPADLTASGNTFRVLLNWSPVTSATAYVVERTVAGTTDTVPVSWTVSAADALSGSGTNAFVDDTAVPAVMYSYKVKALDAQQKESDPSLAATAAVTAELITAANYKVTAKGYALVRDAANNLTFTPTIAGSNPGTIKIALLKKMPANAVDSPEKGIYYLTSLTQVPVLKVDGSVKTLSFDVPVFSLEVRDLAKSVSAKSVTFLTANEFGSITITSTKPSESGIYARTFIETTSAGATQMSIKVTGAVVEEVGSTAATAQPIKLLKVASKTYKDAANAKKTSLGAIGSLPKVVNELQVGNTTSAPAEATPCSILGSVLKSITVSGGPLVADEIVGAIDKVTVSGANLRCGLIQSSKDLVLVQATAKKVSGVLKGGAVGTAGSPLAMVVKGQPNTKKVAIGKVYGQTGVSGFFYAGYDAATGAPKKSGGINILQTKTGVVEGAAFLDPALVSKLKILPKTPVQPIVINPGN